MKTIIRIEHVYELYEMRRDINSLDLDDIIWTEGGKPIKIDQETIRAFELCGLTNMDFITSNRFRKT